MNIALVLVRVFYPSKWILFGNIYVETVTTNDGHNRGISFSAYSRDYQSIDIRTVCHDSRSLRRIGYLVDLWNGASIWSYSIFPVFYMNVTSQDHYCKSVRRRCKIGKVACRIAFCACFCSSKWILGANTYQDCPIKQQAIVVEYYLVHMAAIISLPSRRVIEHRYEIAFKFQIFYTHLEVIITLQACFALFIHLREHCSIEISLFTITFECGRELRT